MVLCKGFDEVVVFSSSSHRDELTSEHFCLDFCDLDSDYMHGLSVYHLTPSKYNATAVHFLLKKSVVRYLKRQVARK